MTLYNMHFKILKNEKNKILLPDISFVNANVL